MSTIIQCKLHKKRIRKTFIMEIFINFLKIVNDGIL